MSGFFLGEDMSENTIEFSKDGLLGLLRLGGTVSGPDVSRVIERYESDLKSAKDEVQMLTNREQIWRELKQDLKDMGVLIDVCLGCSTPTSVKRDCGCPCGTGLAIAGWVIEEAKAKKRQQ